MIMEALGGRRFLMTMGCGIATTVLQWAGKLDPAGSTYAMVTIATVAAYITGNGVQKAVERFKGQDAPAPEVGP